MKRETIDIIKQVASQGQEIKTAIIEYNLVLPKHEDVSETEFFGVKAKRNKELDDGVANLTYTM